MLGTWDFLIVLFLVIGIGYGFIFKKGQIVVLFVSSYISFVIVSELGDRLYGIANRIVNIERIGDWADSVFKIVLFFVIMVLLAIWGEYLAATPGKKGVVNLILSGVYGFLLATMVLSIVSIFLTPELEIKVLALSRLSPYIIAHRMWWFFLPAVLMLVSGFLITRKARRRRR